MFHPWAPGAAFWLAKGTTLYNTLANYMREVLFPAGYDEVKTPLIFNKALWETSGPLAALPPEHVPRRVRARADGREGDELPGPHARVRAARSAATAICRFGCTSRRRCIATKPRACFGPDARPPVLAGRCALLRDGGSDRLGGGVAAAARAARLRGLRPGSSAKLSTRPRGVPRRGRHVGSRGGRAEAGARRRRARPTRSTRATARSTGRRSTSTSPTRSAASGSARRSSSITRCRSGST